MPVFEYKCSDCSNKFEIYHKSSASQEKVICPKCGSENAKKLFSSFSASGFESSGQSYDSCESGSCGIPSGGCASGMCGLN